MANAFQTGSEAETCFGQGNVGNSVTGNLAVSGTLTMTGILNESAGDALTAVGTNRGTSLALTAQNNNVTVGASTTGVTLPASSAGAEVSITNNVANSIHVYGNASDTINGIAGATGIVQPPGTTVWYICTAVGAWISIGQSLPAAKFTTINVTTGTLAAGNASGAAFTHLTSTNATPGSQAMRTVAQVLTDTPGLAVGNSYTLRVTNTGAGTFTLATDGSAQFTMTGTMTVPVNTYNDFVVTINTATTGTVQSVATGPASSPLPPAKFSSINVTTGTLAAGNASGALYVSLTSTNAAPGAQAMRTVAQVLTDTPGLAAGMTYILKIQNTGAGMFTLATDGSAQFTMTGTMTVPQDTWADFAVTINTATTGTVQFLSAGPTVSPVISARTTTAPTNAQNNTYTTNGVLSDLTLTVVAGQKIAGFLGLVGKNATAANGFGLDFNGGTATFTTVQFGWCGTPVGVTTVGTRQSASIATPITITTLTDTNDVVMWVYFTGVVANAGTIIPRFASIGGATTATVEIGANFTLNTTSN